MVPVLRLTLSTKPWIRLRCPSATYTALPLTVISPPLSGCEFTGARKASSAVRVRKGHSAGVADGDIAGRIKRGHGKSGRRPRRHEVRKATESQAAGHTGAKGEVVHPHAARSSQEQQF